jgi:hypothetical protein
VDLERREVGNSNYPESREEDEDQNGEQCDLNQMVGSARGSHLGSVSEEGCREK